MNTKRLFRAAAVLALLSLPLAGSTAQDRPHDTRKEILENIDKAGGVYYMLEYGVPAPSPAPKGYKPVYISHIGRHGARFALSENIYEKLKAFFDKGESEGKLTPEGRTLVERYRSFYPMAAYRGGELTRIGQDQHRFIASTMYRNYPEVFKGETYASVLSTKVHRVIISMLCFLDELEDLDRDFDFDVDAGLIYLPILEPQTSESPESRKRLPIGKEEGEAYQRVIATLDAKGAASRFFNDLDWVEENYGAYDFVRNLASVISDTQCLDDNSERFEGVLTPEEMFAVWEIRNYSNYRRFGRCPLSDNLSVMMSGKVLQDFIVNADKDMAEGKVDLRLRFSHDTALMPLLSFMKVGSMGAEIEDPFLVKDYWRDFEVPMACNLQLVLFRKKKPRAGEPEILVKVLHNEREATLPIPEYCKGFYDWNAFKAYYNPMIEEAARFVANHPE